MTRGPGSPSWAATLILCAAVATAHAGETGDVRAVREIGLTVDDLDRSVAFFTGVLSFEKVSENESAGAELEEATGVFGARVRIARLRLGTETIELTDYLTPRGQSYPWDTRANDRWFQHIAIVVSDMDAAYARLREARVEHASTSPQRLPESIPAAAGIRAFYFRDPDGHFLELLEFPRGKGDARWQADDRLFLGIDHTAVVVSDTARALEFYRDRLGFAVAGSSENSGVEQEHLNNVEGAHLRITTLRAPAGPGVELLEYLAPKSGRTAPAAIRPNDLAYWQTRLIAGPSDDPAEAPAGVPEEAEILRDPDGHVLQILAGDEPLAGSR